MLGTALPLLKGPALPQSAPPTLVLFIFGCVILHNAWSQTPCQSWKLDSRIYIVEVKQMPWPRLLLHVAVVAAGTVAGHRSPKPLAAVAPFYDRAAKQDGVPASVQLRSCLTYTEGCAWTARRRPSHTEAPPGGPQPAGASVPVVVGPAGKLSALQTLQLPSRLGVCGTTTTT